MNLFKIRSKQGYYEYFVVADDIESAIEKYQKRRQKLGYLHSPKIASVDCMCDKKTNIIL